MTRMLCLPCAKALEADGVSLAPAAYKTHKITCDRCGRRRYGLPYETGRTKRKESKK